MKYDDVRKHDRPRWWISGAACMVIGAAALVLSGCSMDDRAGSYDDPTTRAMADPMGYSPEKDPSITGGGISDFNSNDFKRDLDHVLNP